MVMWTPTNPNSCGIYVGDCVIRALSIAMNKRWDEIYLDLCILGFLECDMPNANHVWGKYLEEHGFECEAVKNIGKMTVRSFAESNPHGLFLLATGAHVVAVVDGNYYDTWDSGNEVPVTVWKEK